jgi:hypothetical protein
MPTKFEPTPADLEMLTDTAHIAELGWPRKRPPQDGSADMQARIKQLTGDKASLLNAIDANSVKYHHDAAYQTEMDKSLVEINQQLREADERLREYRAQLQRLN